MATMRRAHLHMLKPTHAVCVLLVTSLLLITLFKASGAQFRHPFSRPPADSDSDEPDFGQYIHISTVTDDQLDFANPSRRVIFVGDIHGMTSSLQDLLEKVDYNSTSDLLIHTGDIVSRGPLEGSLQALSFMSQSNIMGVRGNHDQKVIEWRAWIDRVLSKEGGAEWLEEKEKESPDDIYSDKKSRKIKDWQKIPNGWEINGSHYKVARHMTAVQYDYIRSLSLVLHIPSLHTLVVHAGLVPLDLNMTETSPRQPLGHVPVDHGDDIDELRTIQEHAVVCNISTNRDPWAVTNIRTIRKDNKISRKSKYLPWPTLWNSVISRCAGFDADDISSPVFNKIDFPYEMPLPRSVDDIVKKRKPLPCYPLTVVYGHIAKTGLDIRRWSKGIDTGCVYGRRLSALILSPPESDPEIRSYRNDHEHGVDAEGHRRKEDRARTVPFGDAGMVKAQLVSVKCPEPESR